MKNETNLFSNETLIAMLREGDGLQGLVAKRFPAEAFPAFVHETTHHWCFLSPIGAALAVLLAESDFAIHKAEIVDEVIAGARPRVPADLIRTAYTPVAEGIALFAQNNMRASPAGLYFDPCSWAMSYFTEPMDQETSARLLAIVGPDLRAPELERIPDEDHNKVIDKLNLFLDRERRLEKSLLERSRLFQMRLDARDGGYLAGSTLVMRGFNLLKRKKAPSLDANSFLAFCKQFFFHDTILAWDALTHQGHANAFESRIESRLLEFDRDDLVDRFEDFVAEVSRRPREYILRRWPPTMAAALRLPLDWDIKLDAEMSRRILNSTRTEVEIPGNDGVAAAVYLFRTSMRQCIDLGTLAGRLTPRWALNEDGIPREMAQFEVTLPDGRSARIPLPLEWNPGLGESAVDCDVLFLSPDGSLVYAVYRGIELLNFVMTQRKRPPEEVEAIRMELEERRGLKQNLQIAKDNSDTRLKFVFPDFDGEVRAFALEMTDRILKNCLFSMVAEPARTEVFEKLRKRGLYSLYDRPDRPLQHAWFSAEIACGAVPSGEVLEDFMSWCVSVEHGLPWKIAEALPGQMLSAF